VSGFRGNVAGERKQQAAGERKYALKAGILLKRKVVGDRKRVVGKETEGANSRVRIVVRISCIMGKPSRKSFALT
jgi:hypothetical protein